MRNIFKLLLSGEMFFVLFLTAGAFKESISINFDIAIFFLALSVLAVSYRFFKNPSIYKQQLLPISLISGFLLIMLMGLLYSSSSVYASDKLLKFVMLTVPSFLIPIFLIKDSKESLKKMLYCFVVVSLILSTLAINNYLGGSAMTTAGFGFNDGNYLGLGRVTGLGVILLITLYIFGEYSFFKKCLALVGVMLVSAALLITGSRMPLISFSIILLYALFRSVRYKNGIIYVNKGLKYFVALIAVGAGLLSYMISKGAFATIIFRLEVLFTQSQGGSSAGIRLGFFEEAYRIWANNPIFGTGLGSFGVEYAGTDQRVYPHNIFLELLSELGIVGFSVFIAILIASLINVMKVKSTTSFSYRLALMSCMLYLLLNANVSGDINDNRMLLTFIGILFMTPLVFKPTVSELKNIEMIEKTPQLKSHLSL